MAPETLFIAGAVVTLGESALNFLSPGPIDTPALDPLGTEAKEQFKSLIPRGEMGRPDFVNGIELLVDGGTAQI